MNNNLPQRPIKIFDGTTPFRPDLKPEKADKPKPGKINPVSKKEAVNISSKKKAYKKFDQMMGEQNKRFCIECGSPKHLSHSHLVPVSFNKKLEDVISNIVYDCSYKLGEISCHDKWESHDPEMISSMKSYDVRMDRIKVLDQKYYQILKNKQLTPKK